MIYKLWTDNPIIEIREFQDIITWFGEVLNNTTFNIIDDYYDLFPSIAYNGEFVFLAPEFLGTNLIADTHNFVVGNILNDNLFQKAKHLGNIPYVQDYIKGVEKCQLECQYFSLCKGGAAGNKFFEKGRIDVTETIHCINSVKIPAQVIFNQLNI